MLSRQALEVVKAARAAFPEAQTLHGAMDSWLALARTQGAEAFYVDSLVAMIELLTHSPTLEDFFERLENCYKSHGVDWYMLDQELTLNEMQAAGQGYMSNPLAKDVGAGNSWPAVAFGYQNHIWNWMLREYQERDKFFTFRHKLQIPGPRQPLHAVIFW